MAPKQGQEEAVWEACSLARCPGLRVQAGGFQALQLPELTSQVRHQGALGTQPLPEADFTQERPLELLSQPSRGGRRGQAPLQPCFSLHSMQQGATVLAWNTPALWAISEAVVQGTRWDEGRRS